MTFPTGPSDQDEYIIPETSRKFRYEAATNSWIPSRKNDLKQLDDVDVTVPNENDVLTWQANAFYPQSAAASVYVPMNYGTTAPLSTDVREPGTMWTTDQNIATGVETEAFIATYSDPGRTKTAWTKIGDPNEILQRPVVQVQNVAPTSPEQGEVWFDTTTSPVTKKVYYNTSWRIV